jgi:ATP-binding cassette subfamily F protein 3
MLEMTADRLVLVDSGVARDFDGSIDDYIAFVLAKEPASSAGGGREKGVNKKDQRKAAAEAREKSQELRKRAKVIEGELEKLARQRNAVDQAMFDPSSASGELATLTMTELMKRRAQIEDEVAAAEAKWLEANEAIEAFVA